MQGTQMHASVAKIDEFYLPNLETATLAAPF